MHFFRFVLIPFRVVSVSIKRLRMFLVRVFVFLHSGGSERHEACKPYSLYAKARLSPEFIVNVLPENRYPLEAI